MKASRRLSSRLLTVLVLASGAATFGASCGSSDEEPINGSPPLKSDAGMDASSPGGAGGSAGTSSAGAGGVFGSGGNSGSSGTGAGGSAGEATCDPAFCPGNGIGTPCCVTPQGPCGQDNGMGCTGGPVGDI